MNDLLALLVMTIVGALLAVVYLVGLWLTVRGIHQQRHPVILLMVSITLRMGLVLAVFYFIVGNQRWQMLLGALAGFITVRTVTIRWIRRHMPESGANEEEVA